MILTLRTTAVVGFVLGTVMLHAVTQAATIDYSLTVAQQEINLTGKPASGMTLNGNIPGPTLRFKEGDTARIQVHNKMDVETSIHWHGLLVPPDMDGVPNISFPPIAAGTTFTYEFPIRQSGTYWYHSHTSLQEQRGVYGSIVIEPRMKGVRADRDYVILVSDWIDENPNSVLRTLKRGSEWYSLEKGSGQSILGAARLGKLGDYYKRELQRMPPMDIADVAYDRFLANGKTESSFIGLPGETVRLRIIDGSATTYFHLEFAGGPMRIISADGQDVEPIAEKRFLIGVAETYDVLVKVPAGGAYEFRATAHDGSGYASVWIGAGQQHPAPDVPRPNLYQGMGHFNPRSILALTPAGAMGMPDSMVDAGMFDKPGMMDMGTLHDMPGMDHGSGASQMNMEGMGQGSGTSQMKMGGMDQGSGESQMNMAGMDQSSGTSQMKMGGMDQGSGTSQMKMGGMDHGSGESQTKMEDMDHSANSGDGAHGDGPAMQPSAAEKGMGSADDAMKMSSHESRTGRGYSSDFGFLATDVAASRNLAVDGTQPERPWPVYDKLRAPRSTAFKPDQPVRTIRLTLDGDMERYVWLLNKKPLSESDSIRIREGEVARFVMINRTMMHHPMHLHGHFFRVVNGQGDRSPLKHTVNVAPMSTTVIEFDANEVGDWFFHCHLLYHMKSGMARMVHYDDFDPGSEVTAVRPNLYKDPWYFWGQADILSNMTEGFLTASNTRNIITAEWEAGWQKVDETELEGIFTWSRYINRFTSVFAGANSMGEKDSLDKTRGVLGLHYLLPLNIESRAWVDTDSGARFNLEKEFELTPRLMLVGEAEYDTHELWEGSAGLNYMVHKNVSISTRWQSEYGWGGGVQIRF